MLIQQVLAPHDVWEAGKGKFRSACPFHKGDNNTTFSIFSNGRYRCFKCSAWGDMARLLVQVKRLTLQQARDFLGSAPVPFSSMVDLPLLPAHRIRSESVPYMLMREAEIAPYKKNCPRYLLGRKFSQAALRTFEIGYDLQKAKIVIPVRDWKARLVGLTYRLDFDGDKSQPSKYSHNNFQKSWHLFGFHLWAGKKLRRIHLVEGQLDAVRLYQLGFAACAIMGSDISKEQVELLNRHCGASQIVLAFDRDEAGEKITQQAIKALSKTRYGRDLEILHYDTKDPGELTETSVLSTVPWYKRLAS